MRFISWTSSIRFSVHLLSNDSPLLQTCWGINWPGHMMNYLIVFITCSRSRFLIFNAVCIFSIFLKVDVPCSSWSSRTITCLWSSSMPKCSLGHKVPYFMQEAPAAELPRGYVQLHNLIPMINLLQAYILKGEWHELEIKWERVRSGRKMKAVHRLFIIL